MTKVSAADLRFTQESIACHFKAPHEHFSIREALKKIQTGHMSPDDFPRIRVISHEGRLWSIDNRRLWVFRKGNCSQITVEIMTTMHPRLGDLISLTSRYVHFSRAEFFPRVRKSQNVSPMLTKVPMDIHPSVAEVMSRCGLARVHGSQNHSWPLPTVATTNAHCSLKGGSSGLGWQPRPHRVSLNPSVGNTAGSVTPRLRSAQSSNAKTHMEPFSSSFWGSSSGRQDSSVQRAKEPNADIVFSLRRHSHLEERTSAHAHLLPAMTHDDDRPTESWFGWVRNLIVRCFGRG